MKQFSIRDWMFVAAIVGLIVGWWMDHRRLTAAYNQQMMIYQSY